MNYCLDTDKIKQVVCAPPPLTVEPGPNVLLRQVWAVCVLLGQTPDCVSCTCRVDYYWPSKWEFIRKYHQNNHNYIKFGF